jgi:hypothetical protein
MAVLISKFAGTFAENKDAARDIRLKSIMPALEKEKEIILDFDGVTGATQSFIHALISEALRKYGDGALNLVVFKNCVPVVREVVILVTEYMQES